MEIEYLRTFCTTVELGGMARAASALAMSQPAVSHQIRAIEEHLGVRLLDRTPEGVVLTDYGAVAYRGFESVVQICGQIHGAISQRQGQGAGALRVGATAFPGGYVVPFALRPFAAHHPDVPVNLSVRPAPELLAMLGDGRLDLAFVEGRPDPRGLSVEVLATEPALVVAGPGRTEEGSELSMEQWVALPHVVYGDGCTSASLFSFVDSHRLKAGPFRVSATVEDLEAAKSLVKDGLGLGTFPARAVRRDIQAEALRVLTVQGWNLRVPLTEVHAAAGALTPTAGAFVDQVRCLLLAGPTSPARSRSKRLRYRPDAAALAGTRQAAPAGRGAAG